MLLDFRTCATRMEVVCSFFFVPSVCCMNAENNIVTRNICQKCYFTSEIYKLLDDFRFFHKFPQK